LRVPAPRAAICLKAIDFGLARSKDMIPIINGPMLMLLSKLRFLLLLSHRDAWLFDFVFGLQSLRLQNVSDYLITHVDAEILLNHVLGLNKKITLVRDNIFDK